MWRRLAATIGVMAVVAVPAAMANPLKSLYTTIDLKVCEKIKRHPDGGAWRCAGLPGFPVYLAEGDLRQFLSVGADAERRRAAEQTLGPFNTIFEPNGSRATIEWRFVRRNGVAQPYATIVRFHTSREGRRGDVLVVFKVSDKETCHVAHIDALANSDAIVLARKIADEEARAFSCREEPRPRGAAGKSPM
jgi:hypothetical protein